jgi:hypothetical protein
MSRCTKSNCTREVGKHGARNMCPMHYRQSRKSKNSIRTKANYSELISNIKTRCYNKNNPAYKWYGGRGIKICDRWLENIDNFIEDMGTSYYSGATLDRIDVNGNYEPNNCRWVDWIEQANNRRSNTTIEYKDRTQTLAQWVRELNLKPSTTRQRIYELKWSIEKAFETPNRGRRVTS